MASRLVQAVSKTASLGLPLVALATVLVGDARLCNAEAWVVAFLAIALLFGEALRRRSVKALVFNAIIIVELALLIYYRVH